MLFGGVAGIGQVLEMIPDLIFLTLALILIPVTFFAADQIRNGAELVVDGLEVGDEGVGRVTEQLVQSFTAVQKGVHGIVQGIPLVGDVRTDWVDPNVRLFGKLVDHVIQTRGDVFQLTVDGIQRIVDIF